MTTLTIHSKNPHDAANLYELKYLEKLVTEVGLSLFSCHKLNGSMARMRRFEAPTGVSEIKGLQWWASQSYWNYRWCYAFLYSLIMRYMMNYGEHKIIELKFLCLSNPPKDVAWPALSAEMKEPNWRSADWCELEEIKVVRERERSRTKTRKIRDREPKPSSDWRDYYKPTARRKQRR